MSNYLAYVQRLILFIPTLSVEQSETFIKYAWREIRRASEVWHFNFREEKWLSAALITLQGVGVTRSSSSVVLTHANLEQLGGLNNPSLTQRQLRVGQSGGPVYSITASDVQLFALDGSMSSGIANLNSGAGVFAPEHVGLKVRVKGAGVAGGNLDSTIITFNNPTQVVLAATASTTVSNVDVYIGSTLTLDDLYRETTNANASASVYRSLYTPVNTAFERLDHVTDTVTGYEFGWVVGSADELDQIDPQRGSVGNPYRVHFRGFNQTTGLPVFELWPAPTMDRAFKVNYWSMGYDFTDDNDTLPFPITEELLLLGARIQAYEWGLTQDPDPRRRQSYAAALQFARSRYSCEALPGKPLGLLDEAIRKNDGIVPAVSNRPAGSRSGWPNDSNWWQSHAIPPGY